MLPDRVTLVAHTHWDREWYQPFEIFRARLLEVLDEALELLQSDPRMTFTLDGQVAMVEDYLELRPAREPRIRELVMSGRLHIGPWFTQADTLMVPGEALLRNLAYGIRRAEALGGSMRLGYMPDQFGHAAQLPQVLRLFGIEQAVLWRGIGPERPPHAFRWVAPDGSEVTAVWLQEGYATGRHFPSEPESFASAVERTLERHGPWLQKTPLLLPIGDDHVRLPAWLPEAAEVLRARQPGIQVAISGYANHFGHLGKVEHKIYGELRSPAFAPVLAGVASSRIREKQAAARATSLLLGYAEPLCAWAVLGGVAPPRELIDRAWRQLLLNHAHDSAAGCGSDATHEDVKGRYRWAEQLANVVCEQLLGALQPRTAAGPPPALFVYHPGPSAPALTIEAEIPRALEGELQSYGPDGTSRPVQSLCAIEERPLFEGEFSPSELAVFVQGMDPATPLFGKYLTRLSASPDGPGRIRLDVGMGDAPVPAARMAKDQQQVLEMLPTAQRFRVVVHGSGTTKRVVLSAGPAVAAGFVPIWVRSASDESRPMAAGASAVAGGIAAGSLSVRVRENGTVHILDSDDKSRGPIIANDLTDEGDRGDLYHFDPTSGGQVRARAARTSVLETGPLRARLRIEQDLELPMGLSDDRRDRAARTQLTTLTTEVTLLAGERRVEFVTTMNNEVPDHRLRALIHLPFRAERLDVDHGLTVIDRPLDPTSLGSGIERPALTGPHHLFVDVSDGQAGVALFSRGLPEHEVLPAEGSHTALALTLLRSVGWLARGDLSCIEHAAGPMLPTPGAQELGEHRFEYALLLHRGNWEAGGVLADAQRYALPPRAFTPGQRIKVDSGRSLLEVRPDSVELLAVYPSEIGLVARLLNASEKPSEATLRPAFTPREVLLIDPLEQPIAGSDPLPVSAGTVTVTLRPWQILTLLLRP
jgi:alpha-mannosidase